MKSTNTNLDRKRKREDLSNDDKFQKVIDICGDHSLLSDFSYFLSEDNLFCDILVKNDNDNSLELYTYSKKDYKKKKFNASNITMNTRNAGIDNLQKIHPELKEFNGLLFDGAHWKGYEKGKNKYDSYKYEIQLIGTNNYCQSFACFLWASKGLCNKKHNVQLVKNDYSGNIQKISSLWLKYINKIMSDNDNKIKLWLKNKFIDTSIGEITSILKELIADENLARELSTSKE